MLLNESAWETKDLGFSVQVWQEIARRWQSCAEARLKLLDEGVDALKRLNGGLDATELERGRLSAEVRIFRGRFWIIRTIAALLLAALVWRW